MKWLFLLLILLVTYLLLWPTPVEPVAWVPESIPKVDEPSYRPAIISRIYDGACPACEDVAVDAGGIIYGGSEDGSIRRFRSLNDSQGEVMVNTGGRPLGLQFDLQDNLWVCDAERGLLKISHEGGIFPMATAYQGSPFLFTNDLDIGGSGTVYFTVSSDKFGLDQYKFDLMEHRPRGRLFALPPSGKSPVLLADKLYFANGVALDAEEQFVLICETGNFQIRKVWLSGPKAGQSEVLLTNLPGYPDGISRGSNGVFWLSLISPRKPLLEKLMPRSQLIKMLAKLPAFLHPSPGRFLHILGINAQGEILHNIQQPSPDFSQISSVQEAYGQLFLGSLSENGIGRLEVPR